MSCLGSHIAITAEQRAHLEALPNGEERYFYICDLEELDEESWQTLDKSWDAIHRCLAEGTPDSEMLDTEWGAYPLKLAILGGKHLGEQGEYLVHLIEPGQVRDLTAALQEITEERFAELYWKHCKGAYPEYGEEDLGYSWGYFEEMRDFFVRIAPSGRAVVFSADQ